MSKYPIEQRVLFPRVFSKPLHVEFNTDGMSSDAGVALLSALDKKLGLSQRISAQLKDDRSPARVRHDLTDLLRQRVYEIAAGYPDCSDADSMRTDPCLKVACDRRPLRSKDDLGSQPTLSRLENSQSARSIIDAMRELEDFVIERLATKRRGARRITLDFDSTHDPAFGRQQYIEFSGFYKGWGYLPILGFLSIDDETDQFLCTARLRSGTVRDYRTLAPILRRLVPKIRKRFRRAKIFVRLDSGFYHPMIIDLFEELGVKYVVGFAKNSTLSTQIKPELARARLDAQKTGETATRFVELEYRARSWPRCTTRRTIGKAEVVMLEGRSPRDNARYVITNLPYVPRNVYKKYCKRGDVENRIKELVRDLEIGRTSCTRFLANQMRVLSTSIAYVLFQEFRWKLRKKKAAKYQVGRLRLTFIRIAARVTESYRRLVFHLPRSYPDAQLWCEAAKLIGASTR